jgi:hypothetical protein
MRIKPSTKVHSILRIHPQLEEVLEDHDLDVDEISQMSIRQACGENDLELDEVLEDLKASLRDSATEGWLDVVQEEDESDDDYESDEDDYYKNNTSVNILEEGADAEDDDWN